jgi:hypothetical protein
MSLCLASGGFIKVIAVGAFTLSWMHSVEKTTWEEDWVVQDKTLHLVSARVQGTGAGMEIPEGAVREGKWYRWTPTLKPLKLLTLSRSGSTQDWQICVTQGCTSLGNIVGEEAEKVELSACSRPPRPQQ